MPEHHNHLKRQGRLTLALCLTPPKGQEEAQVYPATHAARLNHASSENDSMGDVGRDIFTQSCDELGQVQRTAMQQILFNEGAKKVGGRERLGCVTRAQRNSVWGSAGAIFRFCVVECGRGGRHGILNG